MKQDVDGRLTDGVGVPVMQIRRMTDDDLRQVNSVFSKSFGNARVEEGLKRWRVSPCRPQFLRMYLDRSGGGAMVAVDGKRVTGFSFSHCFGSTGWMGPVAVLPGYQGAGVGKALVRAGLEYLTKGGCAIIGLETMPRNFRNIGFYLRLGFEAGPLCVDMVSPAHAGAGAEGDGRGEVLYFSEMNGSGKEGALRAVAEISEAISPGLDYRGEIILNMEHSFGDTAVLVDKGQVAGFAVCHLEPYGQFEDRRELKVNVLAVRPETSRVVISNAATQEGGAAGLVGKGPGDALPERALAGLAGLLAGVRALAAREGLQSVRLHLRIDKFHAMRSLLSWGYAVAYSDLRLWLCGYREDEPASCLHFCRWQ